MAVAQWLAVIGVDGTDGGGQVVRTALGLSLHTGEPVTVEGVRGARPDPGLKAQHLAAVEAAASLADASVEGDELGAETVTFRPGSDGSATGGRSIEVDVGTAGSVALVFDAVLPAAVSSPVTVTATGGTHGPWAPTVDYLDLVRRPLLARFGLDVAVSVERAGFYPAGGGRATMTATADGLSSVGILDRGDLEGVTVHSVESESLAEQEVAERQAEAAGTALREEWPTAVERVASVASDSPGSAVLLRATYERSVAGVGALGERGKPAEEVATEAVTALRAFEAGAGAVDEHAADQLLVPLALAGGRVRVPRVTDHVRTNAAVVRAFGYDLSIDDGADGAVVSSTGTRRGEGGE